MSPCCDLDLEVEDSMILWLVMLHHHTKFGAKCSVDQKIPSRQTFTDILNLCCDIDLERNNPIFAQDAPAYDVVLTNQVWLQTDQQFRTYSRNSHFLIIEALTVTLSLKIVIQFFCMTHHLIIIHHHTKFG